MKVLPWILGTFAGHRSIVILTPLSNTLRQALWAFPS
jgi:hypothetical protein